MSEDVTNDLTDDERRVCRDALAFLAIGKEATLRQLGDRPASYHRMRTERDIETARRLIRERFQPKGEGANRP